MKIKILTKKSRYRLELTIACNDVNKFPFSLNFFFDYWEILIILLVLVPKSILYQTALTATDYNIFFLNVTFTTYLTPVTQLFLLKITYKNPDKIPIIMNFSISYLSRIIAVWFCSFSRVQKYSWYQKSWKPKHPFGMFQIISFFFNKCILIGKKSIWSGLK